MRSRAVALVTLVALATTLAGCSRYARRGSAAPPTATGPPVSYGGDIVPPRQPGDPESQGTLVVKVIDGANGKGLGGVVVRAKQGKKELARASTDPRGRARLRLTEGRYAITAIGCGDVVVVDRATEGIASVKRTQELAADIRVDAWKRRFRPTNSIVVYDEAPWDVGERARVGVRVEDRCDFSVGEGGSLAGYRWQKTDTIAFAEDPPARANPEGYAVVTLRCTARGDAEVTVYDPLRPAERVDVLASARQPEGDRPWCGG